MPSWTATSREPGDIPDRPTLLEGRSSPKVKAQVKAAKTAAKALVTELGTDTHIAMSGFAARKDDTEPDQVHVHVVEA